MEKHNHNPNLNHQPMTTFSHEPNKHNKIHTFLNSGIEKHARALPLGVRASRHGDDGSSGERRRRSLLVLDKLSHGEEARASKPLRPAQPERDLKTLGQRREQRNLRRRGRECGERNLEGGNWDVGGLGWWRHF